MSCLLGLEPILIWMVVIIAVIAIVRILLGVFTSALGTWGSVLAQVVNVILWAAIGIAVILVIFWMIGCLVGSIGAPHFR